MDVHKPTALVCPGCEREVPTGASYCPYCCGDDGRDGAQRRGAFIGGLCGLMAGGVFAALWSTIVGADRATWSATLGVVFACTAVGALCGILRQRRQQ
jgi:hypothetical protein